MAYCMTAVGPLLTHWSYCNHALSSRNDPDNWYISLSGDVNLVAVYVMVLAMWWNYDGDDWMQIMMMTVTIFLIIMASHPWLNSKGTCVSKGVTSLLHWVIDMILHQLQWQSDIKVNLYSGKLMKIIVALKTSQITAYNQRDIKHNQYKLW